MGQSKKRKKKRRNLIITSVLVIGVLFAFIYSLTYGGSKPIPEINANENIIDKLKDAQLEGKIIEATSNDINKIINLALGSEITKKGVTVKGMYSKIENGKITFYAKLKYKGIHFQLSSREEIRYEHEYIIIIPENIKIGLLPMPTGFLMGKLIPFSGEKIKITESDIEISQSMLPIKIDSIETKGDKLLVKVEKDPELQAIFEKINEYEEKNPTKPEQIKENTTKPTKTNNVENKQRKRDGILKNGIAQLSAAERACSYPKGKELIRKAQAIMKKMVGNPEYSYLDKVEPLRSFYDTFTDKQKEIVKEAIFGNVDVKALTSIQ